MKDKLRRDREERMTRRLISKEAGVVPDNPRKRPRNFYEDDDVILYKKSTKRAKLDEYDDEYDYEEDEEGEEEIEEDQDQRIELVGKLNLVYEGMQN